MTDEVPDIVWFELDSLHWSKSPVLHWYPCRSCHSWYRDQRDTPQTSRNRIPPGHSRRQLRGIGFLEAWARVSRVRFWCLVTIESSYPAMFTARPGGTLRVVFQFACDRAAARVTLASRLVSQAKLSLISNTEYPHLWSAVTVLIVIDNSITTRSINTVYFWWSE